MNAVKRLEKKMPVDGDPRFIGWIGNPWTPEQMAEAARREPTRKVFWRSLLESHGVTARRMSDPTATLCRMPGD
jgi:hypothetical protein